MKISVHLEADSAEELQTFFAAFQVKQSSTSVTDLLRLGETIRAQQEQEQFLTPELQQATLEPEAPPETADEPTEKPKRGRKPKMAPIVEEPEDEPVEVAPPVLKTPVGPAPKIEVPQPEVSRQDLLDVFSEYVQRYGINFGYTDISNLLQKNLGDGVRKASDVPEESLSKAVVAIRAAINDNPFNRKRDYA